jgi:hypothetical protein
VIAHLQRPTPTPCGDFGAARKSRSGLANSRRNCACRYRQPYGEVTFAIFRSAPAIPNILVCRHYLVRSGHWLSAGRFHAKFLLEQILSAVHGF